MPSVPLPQNFGPIPVRPVAAGVQPLLEQVARGAEQIGAQVLEARRFSEFTAFSGALTRSLNDLDLRFERDPGDPVTLQERYQEASQERLEEHLAGVRDPQVQEMARRKGEQLLERGSVQAGLRGLELEHDAGLAAMENAAEAAQEAAAQALTPEGRAEALSEGRLAIEGNPRLTEVQREARLDVYDRDADLTQIGALIEAGEFDAAIAMLDDREQSAGLDELQRQQARKVVETAREKARVAAKVARAGVVAKTASDLEIAVSRGQAGEPAIEAAFEAGVIGASKRTQLVKEVDRQRAGAVELAGQLQLVGGALEGSSVLDPRNTDHKKAVDAYYGAIQPQIEELPPDLQNEAKAVTSARLGIVPEAVQGELRGSLRAGSEEQIVQAADLYDRLREKNLQTLNDFTQEDIELAVTVQTLIRAGVDPGQAVTDTQDKIKRSPQEQEIREDLYRRQTSGATGEPAADFLEDELGEFFAFDAEIPHAMVGEFDFVARESFLRTGNIDAARETAVEVMRRTWGETNIGRKRWQKYAPEVVYDNGVDPEWIEEQLAAEAGQEDLRLESDLLTGREAQPSYLVMIEDDNGVLRPMLDANSIPLRWRPDWATSPAAQRVAEAQAGEVEAAIEERAFRQANPHLFDFTGEATPRGVGAKAPKAALLARRVRRLSGAVTESDIERKIAAELKARGITPGSERAENEAARLRIVLGKSGN